MKISLLFSLLLTALAQADETYSSGKKIIVGLVEFPPLVIHQTGKPCEGEAIDVTRTVLQNLDAEVEYVCAPAARIYKMIQNGIVDLTINVADTRAIKPHVKFLPTPVTSIKVVLLHNPGIMNTKSVAVIRGFDYQGGRQRLEEEGYTFVDVPSASDTYNLFAHQRTGYLLTYLNPYRYFILHSEDPTPQGIERLMESEYQTYYGITHKSAHAMKLEAVITDFVKENNTERFISPDKLF